MQQHLKHTYSCYGGLSCLKIQVGKCPKFVDVRPKTLGNTTELWIVSIFGTPKSYHPHIVVVDSLILLTFNLPHSKALLKYSTLKFDHADI